MHRADWCGVSCTMRGMWALCMSKHALCNSHLWFSVWATHLAQRFWILRSWGKHSVPKGGWGHGQLIGVRGGWNAHEEHGGCR